MSLPSLRTGLGLLIAALTLSAHAAESGVITGFQLSTCSPVLCTRIESPRVLQGQFGLFTLEDVKVSRHIGQEIVVYEGHDAVLDLRDQTLTIRKVTRGPAKDLWLSLESGQVMLF